MSTTTETTETVWTEKATPTSARTIRVRGVRIKFSNADSIVELIDTVTEILADDPAGLADDDAIDEPGPPAVEVTPKASLRAALNTVGYDDDRIFRIDRDGAYWDDANPLVRACRKVSR